MFWDADTIEDAADKCEEYGGMLAKIETQQQENAFMHAVSEVDDGTCVYFGAIKESGSWVNRDGTDVFVSITEDTGGEYCSCYSTSNGNFYDAPCANNWQGGDVPFVCYFDGASCAPHEWHSDDDDDHYYSHDDDYYHDGREYAYEFCESTGMRQMYARDDDGERRCDYNPNPTEMEWYTHDCCAEDMDIPVTAGVTYWFAVTGAVGRAAAARARARRGATACAQSLCPHAIAAAQVTTGTPTGGSTTSTCTARTWTTTRSIRTTRSISGLRTSSAIARATIRPRTNTTGLRRSCASTTSTTRSS